MKKILMITSLVAFSITGFASDVVQDKMQGIRNSNGEPCTLAHRQLDYSYPELFISFQSAANENFKTPDAGLLEVMGVDYQTYTSLLYGTQSLSINSSKGGYNYSVTSSSSGTTRTVTIQGISAPVGNKISNGTIVLKHGDVDSITISKQSKGLIGWKKTFEDTCSSLSKI